MRSTVLTPEHRELAKHLDKNRKFTFVNFWERSKSIQLTGIWKGKYIELYGTLYLIINLLDNTTLFERRKLLLKRMFFSLNTLQDTKLKLNYIEQPKETDINPLLLY